MSPFNQLRVNSLFPARAYRLQSTVAASEVKSLDFEDHKDIFKFKTTWELARALIVLKVCSIDFFVDNSLYVSSKTKRSFISVALVALTVKNHIIVLLNESAVLGVAPR